jgi:hypothetical protein
VGLSRSISSLDIDLAIASSYSGRSPNSGNSKLGTSAHYARIPRENPAGSREAKKVDFDLDQKWELNSYPRDQKEPLQSYLRRSQRGEEPHP